MINFWDFFKSITIPIAVLYFVSAVFTIYRIIKDTQNPTKALAYIMLTVMLPIAGVFIYFSFGINYRKRKLYSKKLISDKELYDKVKGKIVEVSEQRLLSHTDLIKDKENSIKMLLTDSSLATLYPVKDAKLLVNGENKFKCLLEDLEKAKEHIHIQYYIYQDDVIGNEVKDVLIRKAKEGVKVRFMFDDFGSRVLRNKMVKELEQNSVEVAIFYKIKFYALANSLNYRNHRKIVVIDGKIGYVGGINIADRYINEENSQQLYWRDTHLRLEGEAVNGLQYTFLNDWNFCSKNPINIVEQNYFNFDENQKESDCLVQIAASGPDSPRATIMLAYAGVMMSSRQRLYITSPYLIPNETIADAIKYAALGGVDVRLIVPYKSDSIFVNAASSSYYQEFLESGVRIFRYKKGFVHAKTIVVDDNLSIIGSANIDMRSFELNFEVSAMVYGKDMNQQLANVFLDDLKDCEEISLEQWRNRSKLSQFGSSVAKLISPLL